MDINIKTIKQLIKIMKTADLIEISLSQKEESIILKRRDLQSPIAAFSPMSVPSTNPVSSQSLHDNKDQNLSQDDVQEIESPMVATFYQSSSPKDPPFVKKGMHLSQGDPLCILEAMKLMNEFKSDYSGTIIDILVKDGDPVEFGQPLFLIKKDV